VPVKNKGYAFRTDVDIPQSKAELERILTKGGADQVLMGGDAKARTGFVLFGLNGRNYRLSLPKRVDVRRKAAQVDRERWRTLVLITKGQVEMIKGGVATPEEVFLPALLLPTGNTVAEEVGPKVEELYRTGKCPPLLPESITRLLPSG
jgi:vacuolar-type H+-ATPase subunit F/Vma7